MFTQASLISTLSVILIIDKSPSTKNIEKIDENQERASI